MVKYIAIVDYKAGACPGFGHFELTSKDLVSAMDEAERLRDETVYLVDIAEYVGKSTDSDGSGAKRSHYKPVLRNRSGGWHHCDVAHGDNPAMWDMVKIGKIKFFEMSK